MVTTLKGGNYVAPWSEYNNYIFLKLQCEDVEFVKTLKSQIKLSKN